MGAIKNKKRAITYDQIEDALKESKGILSVACEYLGCTRDVFELSLQKVLRLRKLKEDLEEAKLDDAEAKLQDNIKNGNLSALIFYLKTKGKSRGYVEGNMHPQPPAKPMSVKIVPAPGVTLELKKSKNKSKTNIVNVGIDKTNITNAEKIAQYN